jgi:hypothetical protein
MGMMFGCIHVPDFPVQAALLDEPQDQALALVDGSESLLKVVSTNKAARSAGVRIGITKLQAEAFGVELRKRISTDEESAQAALLDCAYNFSPRVEATAPGTIIFDLSGSERLMGDDNVIARLVMAQVTDRGFDCNVSGEKDSQGRGRVGFVTLLDSNRLDDFQVTRSPAKSAPHGESVTPAHLLHRFRPAIPARVEASAQKVPMWVGFLQKRAKVIEVSGPWQRDGEWWDSKDKWLREEWDIQLNIGGLSVAYRFYRDLSTKKWFVEGIYD